MNTLPQKKFREIDDLLAFISIYDDQNRTNAYFKMLEKHRDRIAGGVCVEAGCGLGVFAAKMAELGARKVYAVEQNPILSRLAESRLKKYPNVQVIPAPLRNFSPNEDIDVLLHEFYGQFLYDEDLHALNDLQFSPGLIMPDGGALLCGVHAAADYVDDIMSSEAIAALEGVLVSGLFQTDENDLQFPVLEWRAGEEFPIRRTISIQEKSGDLLVFGVQVTHAGEQICIADACDNWATVWTPRRGDAFEIGFQAENVGEEVAFHWLAD